MIASHVKIAQIPNPIFKTDQQFLGIPVQWSTHPSNCMSRRTILCINPFYPEYDSSRSYPFYPEYDSGRSLHLARLPRTLTFWNPIGWLTPNDVSISGSLGNPYFSTNQCRSLGICRPKSAPPSQSEIKDGVESQRSVSVSVSVCLLAKCPGDTSRQCAWWVIWISC